MGSSEQLPDSDSEGSQQAAPLHETTIELNEVSMDEDQASWGDSLDLSSQSTADPEQDREADPINPQDAEPPTLPDAEPPTLPDTEPPDEQTKETEEQLSWSMAELNVNQSNNNLPGSPILRDLSGIQLIPLCTKKLPLSRNRLSQPDFV